VSAATRPLGVQVMPPENRRATILQIATTADRLGYDAFFLSETWAHDTTVMLADVAAQTRRIHLGSAILGIWGRSAATLAMAASTLHTMSGGRFILGLGVSTAQLTEGLHDVPFSGPLARMRQVVTQIRALLKGERIPLAVAAGARPLRLNMPPASDLPIYLAGLGDAIIGLTGELADGWFPFLIPRDRLADCVDLLKQGAARTTDPSRLPRICPIVPTVVADDPGEARKGAASLLVFYLTTMGPFYPKMIAQRGFAGEVAAIQAANPTRDTAVVPPEAETLLDQLTIFGTPEECRARLAPWYAAGAALPILFLRPNLTPREIDFTLSAFR
jgi:alkanesulfonate monooxygenase SsuD/methylene tetrahydromethanopterin reductase-like flavin-dependent oxidoreductase (luciferase family)